MCDIARPNFWFGEDTVLAADEYMDGMDVKDVLTEIYHIPGVFRHLL